MSEAKLARNYLSNHPTLGQDGGSKSSWIAQILHPALPGDLAANILEIGPGRGEGLTFFKSVVGYKNVFAIDNSPEVVELCRPIIGHDAMVFGDVFAFLQDGERQYDLIFLYHVLEHFPPPQVLELLTALEQALAPGGVLVVGVPNAAAPIIGVEQQYFDFTHQTAFSPWSLKQAIKTAGFSDVEIKPVWPPGRSVGRVLQRMIQKLALGIMRAYLRIFTGVPRPVLTHSMVAYCRKTVTKTDG